MFRCACDVDHFKRCSKTTKTFDTQCARCFSLESLWYIFQVIISECTKVIESELFQVVYNALAGTRTFKHLENVNIKVIR